ncbi:MAG: DUF3298 domain-containing protein [Cyclobacteriaceae bacterium]
MKRYFVYFAFGIAIAACEPATQENSEDPKPAEPSEFRIERFYASFENCESTDENCTYFEVSYPVFEGASLEAVNQFISDIKSPVFDPDLRMLPLDSIASDFITNYAEFKRDFPESSQSWFTKHQITVENEVDSAILIAAAINEYGGGAHGNYAINYYQVNKATGKPIVLADLYSQEEVDRMGTIMSVSIDPSISLLTETIVPNENFILSNDSITFIYNPYEIAPYSEGVIRLSLPRDQSPIM